MPDQRHTGFGADGPAVTTTTTTSASPSSSSRKRILVLGGRKSGKTSCIRTVFSNLAPKDTIWLEMTTQTQKLVFDSVLPLELWDTPSSFDPLSPSDLTIPWTSFSSIVYVIDIQQDNYAEPISRLVPVFVEAYAHNPDLNFEVFAHKSDGLSAEYQEEYFSELSSRIMDQIAEFDVADHFATMPATSASTSSDGASIAALAHIAPEDAYAFLDDLSVQITFHITSVNDPTLFQAWSGVVQKLMEGIYGAMEGLMNTFVDTSGIDKSYIFDINAKIFVATDMTSVETSTFKLCSEWLGRMLTWQSLYKDLPAARRQARLPKPNGTTAPPPSDSPSAPSLNPDSDSNSNSSDIDPDELEWPTQVTRLSNNSTIAYWQFSDRLGLICNLRSDTYQSQEGMIEYNVTLLRKGVLQILEAING